jgi:prepilin-type N-terminal cleavage/methylation domain-containing protein
MKKTISKPRNKAFTLIELMIVVVIIGVMASLVVPRLFGQSEKARAAEAVNMLGSIRRAEQAYFDRRGEFLHIDVPAKWERLGIGDPNLNPKYWTYQTSPICTSTSEPQRCNIIATRLNTPDAPAGAAGREFRLYASQTTVQPWAGTGIYAPGGGYVPAN